jgi:hypothetical protein
VSLRSVLLQNHFCGGFIITEQWLGTAGDIQLYQRSYNFKAFCFAAHCTSGRQPWGVVAVVGAVSRTLEGTKVKLAKFVAHPDYDVSNDEVW